MPTDSISTEKRPPVVAILGHIDHGKSTLLDYIRKSNIVDSEAGGITQHISAYEIIHNDSEHGEQRITFIDTPGHEAFTNVRSRGASIADIGILIVSAEDGVMPQTKEALESIKASGVPFVVAITKIDSPKANIDMAKNSLIENEVYLEGLGGDIPFVPISAKSGENVDELLSMILLVAELEELKMDVSKPAEGIVVEAHKDMKRGICATVVIKEGSLSTGSFMASETAMTPVRAIEDTNGTKYDNVAPSTPIVIFGWSDIPPVGAAVKTFDTKKEAEKYCKECASGATEQQNVAVTASEDMAVIPLIIKTDVAGTTEAVVYEVNKLNSDSVQFTVVQSGTGDISEADMKMALANENTVVIGMGVSIDPRAEAIREREGVTVVTYKIIYELIEWLEKLKEDRRPRKTIEKLIGVAKILAVFNRTKKSQVVGGKAKEGEIILGSDVRILRRNELIGTGVIKELQQQKLAVDKVQEGNEFGMAIATETELAENDHIEVINRVVE